MPYDPFKDMQERLAKARQENRADALDGSGVSIKSSMATGIGGVRSHRQPYDQAQIDALNKILNPEPEPTPDLFQRFGPAVARGAGMALGFTPAKAFGAGAIGEGIAQTIEKAYGDRESYSLPELAAAAVVGGVGGKMVGAIGGAKTALQGAKLAAPYAVAQPFLHSGISNMQDVADAQGFVEGAKQTNPMDVLISGGAGTATGAGVGLLNKFLSGRAAKAAAPANKFEVETTARTGGQVLGKDGKLETVRPIPPISGNGGPGVPPAGAAPAAADPFAKAQYGSQTAGEAAAAEAAAAAEMGRQPSGTRVLDPEEFDAIFRTEASRNGAGYNVTPEGTAIPTGGADTRIPYNSGDAEVFQEPRIKAQIAKENAQRQVAMAKQNLEEQAPVVSETYRGEGPDGRQTSVTRKWTAPVDEDGNPMVGAVPRAKPLNKYQSPPVDQAMPPEVSGDWPTPPGAGEAVVDMEKVAANPELARMFGIEPPPQPLTNAVAPPAIAPIEAPAGPRPVRNIDALTGEVIPPPPAQLEAPFTERRVTSERMGEQYRGTDLAALQKMLNEVAAAKKPADVTLASMTPEQLNLGGTSAIPDPRDAKVAQLLSQPFEMSGEDIVAGAQKMRQGFAERAGKGFEKPRGGDVPVTGEVLGPEANIQPAAPPRRPSAAEMRRFLDAEETMGVSPEIQAILDNPTRPSRPIEGTVVEAPSSPVEAISSGGPGATPTPLFKSRQEAAAAHYRELQNLFGKSKGSQNPVEALGYEAARRQGRLAQAEAKGVNTAEVGAKPKAVKPEMVAKAVAPEAAPLSNEWFDPQPLTQSLPDRVPVQVSSQTARQAGAKDLAEALGLPNPAASPERAAAMANSADPTMLEWAKTLLTGSDDEVRALLKAGAPKNLKGSLGKLLKNTEGGISPEAAAQMGLMGTGAALGYATDPMDNPLVSALAGGAIGAAIPALLPKIAALSPKAMADPNIPVDAKNVIQKMMTTQGQSAMVSDMVTSIPHVMRANLLYSPNIINNSIVGPWANAFWGAVEGALAGDARAIAMLQDGAVNPVTWIQSYPSKIAEARQIISTAEGAAGERIGSTIGPGANKALREYTERPGIYMTAGDKNTRDLFELYGYSPEEARVFTMTNDPELKLTKAAVNFQRTSGPIGQVLQPFAKTVANIAEQGAYRTPVVGEIAQMFRATPDPIGARMVQQGIGGTLGGAAYLGGSNFPTDTNLPGMSDAKTLNLLRSFLSNAGGRYSLPIAMGLAAGLASQSNDNLVAQGVSGVKEGFQGLPLPSFDILNSYMNTAEKASEGNLGWSDAPQGLVPNITRSFGGDDKPGKKGKKGKSAKEGKD